jgi:hypothetical protein
MAAIPPVEDWQAPLGVTVRISEETVLGHGERSDAASISVSVETYGPFIITSMLRVERMILLAGAAVVFIIAAFWNCPGSGCIYLRRYLVDHRIICASISRVFIVQSSWSVQQIPITFSGDAASSRGFVWSVRSSLKQKRASSMMDRVLSPRQAQMSFLAKPIQEID